MPKATKSSAAPRPALHDIPATQFRIASYASAYFVEHPDPAAIRKLYTWYTKNWGEQLHWLLDSVTARHRPFDRSEAEEMLRRWLKANPKKGNLLWASFGGDTHHAVSEWFTWGKMELGKSCNIQLSWPIEQTKSFWEEHMVRALKVFDVPLDYGYGGLLLSWPPHDRGRDRTHVPMHDQLLRRFSGLDPVDSLFHGHLSLVGIRSPGWLTAIGWHHIEYLPKGTLERLPTEIVVHKLRHCAVLQLGPAPKLGDVNAKEDMSLYRAAAAALKPLRPAEPHGWSGNYLYKGHDWLSRFD